MPSSNQREAISRMLDAEEALVVKNDFAIEEEQGIEHWKWFTEQT